jgi:DNA-binding beta-propeller fold protein YncE
MNVYSDFFRRLLKKQRPFFLWIVIFSLFLSGCGVLDQKPLNRPTGVTALANGTVYIVDRGNFRVVRMDENDRVTATFGKLGTEPSDLYRAWDIATDSQGNVYVCNMIPSESKLQAHEGIKVFDPHGNFLKELDGKDYPDGKTGERPYGIDIDSKDRVYVIYNLSSYLRIFDKNGNLLANLFGESGGEPGQSSGFIDVAVDDRRNLVYLSDQSNSRIQQFERKEDSNGGVSLVYRQSFGSYGRRPGQFAYPANLAVDEESGKLYVGDMANQRIQVFDSEGKMLSEFTSPNSQTWQVLGLSFVNEKLYAVDTLNNLIWVFDPNGKLIKKLEVKS